MKSVKSKPIPETAKIEQSPWSGRPLVRSDFEPEFVRVEHAVAIFGIGRSKLYELIRAGEIESVSLKKPGQHKATRLIGIASMREFMRAHTAH